MRTRLTLFVLALVTCAALADARAEPFAYVPNDGGNISVIDTASNTVVATIPEAGQARSVAVHPTGAFAYVENRISGQSRIAVIDTATNTVITEVPVGRVAGRITISPDGGMLYVPHRAGTGPLDSTVALLDTTTNTIVNTFTLGSVNHGKVVVHPSGSLLYVIFHIESGDAGVAVVDATSFSVLDVIPTNPLAAMAIHPVGTFVYAVGTCCEATVSVIDTAVNEVVTVIPIGGRSQSIAVHPAGTFVYAGHSGTTLSVIDTDTNAVVETVPVEGCCENVAVHPDGPFVYGALPTFDAVSVANTSTNTEVARIPVGEYPRNVGLVGPGAYKVTIDIKPGSEPNSINLSSAGVIPVSILSSPVFDAPVLIDPETLSLAGAKVRLIGNSNRFLCNEEDTDGDGLWDLVCQVETEELLIVTGDSTAVLEAETFAGVPVRGEDNVRIVPD